MTRWLGILVALVCSLAFAQPAPRVDTPAATTQLAGARFLSVDVFVDAKTSALGAYQVEFAVETGKALVVGLTAGEHPAYANTPPYYDPAALTPGHERLIFAAFSTDASLPRGRTRVASIQLMVEGDATPQYAAKLVVAADEAGKAIGGATVSLSQGVQR
jgi:hypothetical protein